MTTPVSSKKWIMLAVGWCIISANGLAAAPICSQCTKITELTNAIKKLNYMNSEEKFKAEEMGRNSGLPLITGFARVSKTDPNRSNIFRALLGMVQAASPYDGEAILTQALATIVRSDQALKKTYNQYVLLLPKSPKAPDSCTAQLFKSDMAEQICLQNLGVMGQGVRPGQEKQAEKCTAQFNYETCLASVTR